MEKRYIVAGHCFAITGERLCRIMDTIAAFRPFETMEEAATFSFVEDDGTPLMTSTQYTLVHEQTSLQFGTIAEGYMLILKPEGDAPLYLWHKKGNATVSLCGNVKAHLLQFALWIGYGLMTLPTATVAIHSSCIVHRDKAVLFLGESGTGKSTHTRLWQQHIEGSSLLNDDSPIVRWQDGKLWVYGSPWSGKTPCYKQQRYELQGCVRLSQAPVNSIKHLQTLYAYAALHPSCPPEFAYDNSLYDKISTLISEIISKTPVYHLQCLPDAAAVQLSQKTLFCNEKNS